MRLGPTEEEQSPGFSSVKISAPGIRSMIYMDYSFLKLDQVYIFLREMGHLKLTSSHFWVRHEKLLCRHDLAWDQSFTLTGVRLMPKAWELGGKPFARQVAGMVLPCEMILATCFATATAEESWESTECFNWLMSTSSCEKSCTNHNAALPQSMQKEESSSTFCNSCSNKKVPEMSVEGYVTLGNFSCNLCCNKIVRRVAWNVA